MLHHQIFAGSLSSSGLAASMCLDDPLRSSVPLVLAEPTVPCLLSEVPCRDTLCASLLLSGKYRPESKQGISGTVQVLWCSCPRILASESCIVRKDSDFSGAFCYDFKTLEKPFLCFIPNLCFNLLGSCPSIMYFMMLNRNIST